MPTHDHKHTSALPHRHADAGLNMQDGEQTAVAASGLSVLAWPAWLRVAAVLPVVLMLWLGVTWANGGAAPW
jgi:hypothetical protein